MSRCDEIVEHTVHSKGQDRGDHSFWEDRKGRGMDREEEGRRSLGEGTSREEYEDGRRDGRKPGPVMFQANYNIPTCSSRYPITSKWIDDQRDGEFEVEERYRHCQRYADPNARHGWERNRSEWNERNGYLYGEGGGYGMKNGYGNNYRLNPLKLPELEKFDGDGLELDDFMESFNLRYDEAPDRVRKILFKELLQGKVLETWESLPEVMRSTEALERCVEELKKTMNGTSRYAKYDEWKELINLEFEGKAAAYFEKLERLSMSCYERGLEENQKFMLMMSCEKKPELKERYRRLLAMYQCGESFEEMKMYMLREEYIDRVTRGAMEGGGFDNRSRREDHRYMEERTTTCWKCGDMGHMSYECNGQENWGSGDQDEATQESMEGGEDGENGVEEVAEYEENGEGEGHGHGMWGSGRVQTITHEGGKRGSDQRWMVTRKDKLRKEWGSDRQGTVTHRMERNGRRPKEKWGSGREISATHKERCDGNTVIEERIMSMERGSGQEESTREESVELPEWRTGLHTEDTVQLIGKKLEAEANIGGEGTVVVLDTGADASLVPESFMWNTGLSEEELDYEPFDNGIRLWNASDEKIKVMGRCRMEVKLGGGSPTLVDFCISDGGSDIILGMNALPKMNLCINLVDGEVCVMEGVEYGKGRGCKMKKNGSTSNWRSITVQKDNVEARGYSRHVQEDEPSTRVEDHSRRRREVLSRDTVAGPGFMRYGYCSRAGH